MSSLSVIRIYNVTCTTANTEYSQALNSFSSVFQIKCRDTSMNIRLYATSGATFFWTIFGGSSDNYPGPFSGIKTLYFQSDTDGAIVEIIEWS